METFAERMKKEFDGIVTLSPELVEREKASQLGYLVRTRERLGREITEEEMVYLSNIL